MALVIFLAQFATYTQAGIFDSLTGAPKKKSSRKKSRDDRRAEFEEVAKEAMTDKTIKDTRDNKSSTIGINSKSSSSSTKEKKISKEDALSQYLVPEHLLSELQDVDDWNREWQ